MSGVWLGVSLHRWSSVTTLYQIMDLKPFRARLFQNQYMESMPVWDGLWVWCSSERATPSHLA